ncbi:hypothetical protein ACFW9I_22660 [[Kitasatospora] papulosa]|uniref:hypothetical protein n=1 Tax=[Kitasatospora] papulosa TaxID=1464011 RepID=UPI00367C086A
MAASFCRAWARAASLERQLLTRGLGLEFSHRLAAVERFLQLASQLPDLALERSLDRRATTVAFRLA